MQYCAKCHKLCKEGTVCSDCTEPLTEPKSGNLILLTAVMYEESNKILDAFREKGIYIDRQPTIEHGVFELFVQYNDWTTANELLEIVLQDLEDSSSSSYDSREELTSEKQPILSNRKKWVLRIIAAASFGLLIWGVVSFTDFAMSFVKEWFF